MNNDELREWNEPIKMAQVSKLDAMERAIRSRGIRRWLYLLFARWFGWVESVGTRWRER